MGGKCCFYDAIEKRGFLGVCTPEMVDAKKLMLMREIFSMAISILNHGSEMFRNKNNKVDLSLQLCADYRRGLWSLLSDKPPHLIDSPPALSLAARPLMYMPSNTSFGRRRSPSYS